MQVREILLSHFGLFEPIWELYITIAGKRDSLVLAKCLDLSSISLADLGVKNSKMVRNVVFFVLQYLKKFAVDWCGELQACFADAEADWKCS